MSSLSLPLQGENWQVKYVQGLGRLCEYFSGKKVKRCLSLAEKDGNQVVGLVPAPSSCPSSPAEFAE